MGCNFKSTFSGSFLSFLLIFLVFSASMVHGQSVKRGERPPIDLHAVSDDAMEPGVIRIKLHATHGEKLQGQQFEKGENGTVRFNIGGLDRLNHQFMVQEAAPTFGLTNKDAAIAARHEQWGFPLWVDLKFNADVDIRAVVEAYNQLPEVEIAEPLYRIELIGHVDDPDVDEGIQGQTLNAPNDPGFVYQWHYHNTGQVSGTPGSDISLLEAWQIEAGKPNVVVAIIDGGIQVDHPDLAANMWSGIGYNFVTNSPNVTPHNHGTHVGGTVAAVNNNSVGLSGVAGGSGNGDGVRLMSLQVFTDGQSGGFHLAPIFAADNGAAISQNSWGYTSPGVYNQAVLDAIDYFNAHGGGGLMEGGITIFAAGNSNSSADWYPAYYSGALSVASTNNQDKKAWYSNFGEWVDISAPGGETSGNVQRGVYSTLINSSYGFYQGTSMACPHVSGVAALILSKYPGQYTAAELRDILVLSADDHYAVNPNHENMLGSGRLNAYNALLLAQSFNNMPPMPGSLAASAVSDSQINVSWTKNNQQNDVLVAFSLDGVFGTPEQGATYNAGATLTGGGKVLYRGSQQQFSHTGLQLGTHYFYKAWSVNSDKVYSIGTPVVSENTGCGVVSTLPYVQPFYQASLPLCWSIQDHEGSGQVWQFGTFNNGLAGNTGNYAYLNSDGYGQGNTQNADLISPTFDLSNYNSVTLSFDHYFRQYQSSSQATLSYSIDNGQTWTTIQQWNSNINNPTAFSQEINAVAGKSQVKFKWNYTATWGYYWSVDNIVVDGTTGTVTNHTLSVSREGQGNTSPLVGNHTYASGSQVTLSATPASGWTFDKWIINGQNHASSSVTLTMNQNTQAKAVFTENPVSYTLSVGKQGQGNTSPAAGNHTYESGSQVTLSAVAASGWSFEKWVINGQNFTNSNVTITMNANVQATAVFTEDVVNYTLTVGSQGQGTTNPASGTHTFESGTQVTLSATPASGWSFDKWVINGQNFSASSITLTVNADVQATAVFTENAAIYTLNMGQQGQGTTNPGTGSHTFESGTQVTLSATAASGWSLDKWIIDGETISTSSVTLTMSSNKEATAVFVEDIPEYTLTVGVQGQGSTTPGTGSHTYQSGSQVTLSATAASGWSFDKWVINGQNFTSSSVTLTVNADVQATAVFTENTNTHTLSIGKQGEGTTNPAPGTYTYESGSQVTISAAPASGYTLDKWIINGQSYTASSINLTITGDVQATAVFVQSAVNYTLSINTQGQGTTNPSPGTHTFQAGSVVTLTAMPQNTWVFVRWNINGQDHFNPVINVTMNQNTQARAIFRKQNSQPGTVSVSGYGETNPPAGTHYYEEGESVNFTATPMYGWKFGQWVINGQVYTDSNVNYVVDGEFQATAIFLEVPPYYMLHMDQVGAGRITPDVGSYQHEPGQTVRVNAVPDEGWAFVKWVINGNTEVYESNYDVLIENTTTVVAYFESTTSVIDDNPMAELMAYPNPSQGQFTIGGMSNIQEATLRLFDMQGREWFMEQVENAGGSSTYSVNAGGLPPGVYFLNLVTATHTWTQRLIIRR
jgi:subtilisin family serine protease